MWLRPPGWRGTCPTSHRNTWVKNLEDCLRPADAEALGLGRGDMHLSQNPGDPYTPEPPASEASGPASLSRESVLPGSSPWSLSDRKWLPSREEAQAWKLRWALILPSQEVQFGSVQFGSVRFSHSGVSDSLWPNGLQHTRPPRPSPAPKVYSDWVSDAIQPSQPLSSPSPPALNLSQHRGLFKWVSSSHQVVKVLEIQLQHQSFQWIFRTDFL